MMNVAKALALAGCRVYLCSAKLDVNVDGGHVREISPSVFVLGEEFAGKRSMPYRIAVRFVPLILVGRYVRKLLHFVKMLEGQKVFYLYPQPEISVDLAALVLVKYLNGFRIYADINELRTTTLGNDRSGSVLRSFSRMIRYKLSERLTTVYDGLVAISTRLEKYFSRYNPNIIRVPILCGDAPSSTPCIAPFSTGNTFKLCFTGEIRLGKEGMEDLYQSFAKARDRYKNMELHLYGPVLKEQEGRILRDLPAALSIGDAICYHGIVDQSTLAHEICQYHLLLLVRPKTPQAQFGFSTKLGEYLVSGVPVLTTDTSDIPLFLKDGENAFVVTRTDPDIVSNKILDVISRYEMEAVDVVARAQKTARDSFHFAKYSQTLSNFLAA